MSAVSIPRTARRLLALGLSFVLAAPGFAAVAARRPAGPNVRFPATAGEIHAIYQEAMGVYRQALRAVAAVPIEDASFDNTVRALELAQGAYNEAIDPLIVLGDFAATRRLRRASGTLYARYSDQEGAWAEPGGLHDRIYERIKAAAARNEELDEADARLLRTTLAEYRDGGYDLPDRQRQKLMRLHGRLFELQSEYERNLADERDWLVLNESEIAGLPEDFVAGMRRDGEGRYLLEINRPNYQFYLEYAHSDRGRREMQKQFDSRAKGNIRLVKRIMEIRQAQARLLGYKSYAQFAVKDEMAGTVSRVGAFLGRVKAALAPRLRRELAEMLAVKREFLPRTRRIELWDRYYYPRLLRERDYGYDAAAAREYFPLDAVLEGTFEMQGEALGVSIRELKRGSAWHEDVRLFEVSDKRTGEVVSHFYMDLHPRPGKYSHVAMMTLVGGGRAADGGYRRPVGSIIGNFLPPAGGVPALMTHQEVEDFLHEFGHLLQGLLTEAEHVSQAGIMMTTDSVEAASQMNENMAWDKGFLRRVSSHYKTGERMPDAMIDAIISSREHMTSVEFSIQLGRSFADLLLHTAVPKDVSRAFNRVMEKYSLRPVAGSYPVASVEHLVSDYGGRYYGYLWSEALAEDLLRAFRKAGLLSRRVNARYRREFLSRGSSRAEEDSINAFLGREWREEPFLRRLRGGPVRRR